MSTPAMPCRKFWGWGYEGAGPTAEQQGASPQLLAARFGVDRAGDHAGRRGSRRSTLRAPRVAPPAALAEICSTDAEDRAGHTYGKSFRDVVRALRARLRQPARRRRASRATRRDVVGAARLVRRARARSRSPTAAARASSAASRPAGGRPRAARCRSTSARLDRVLEVDRASRAARIQAGVLGPALEDQLRPHGFTLRHFPQSFEFSTLGGWIATRSGGHFATLYTHIDDFVESLRVVTPSGADRDAPPARLGRRPEPRSHVHRLRGHPRHHHRGVDAPAGPAALRAVGVGHVRRLRSPARAGGARARARPGLHPANCRLLDAGEALTAGAGDGTEAVLVLGFESADHAPDALDGSARSSCAATTAATCRRAPGETRSDEAGAREGAAGAWRQAFLDAPVPARRAAAHGHDQRDVRDRDHLGPLPELPRARDGGDRGRAAPGVRRRLVTVPLHARLSRRAGAVLHGHRAGDARRRSSRSGRRSRPRRRRRSSRSAARSRTTTRSAATTGRGTTASARTASRARSPRPSARSTRSGILNPGVLIEEAHLRQESARSAAERKRAEECGPVGLRPMGRGGPVPSLKKWGSSSSATRGCSSTRARGGGACSCARP